MRHAVALLSCAALAGCRCDSSTAGAPDGVAAAGASGAPSAQRFQGITNEERAALSGRIVFVSERDGNREIYWLRPDGTSLTRVTDDAAEDYPAPQRPKSPKLLLIRATGEHQTDHSEQLMAVPWSGGAASLIGKPASRIRNPSWFPAGDKVVIEAAIDGFRDLYIVSMTGEIERLTDDPKGSFEPQVSPDGSSVVFVSSREDDAEIYLMKLPERQLERLTWSRGDDSFPTFAPNGETIAFVSMRATTPRLHIMNRNGSKPRLLGGDVSPDHIEDRDLTFSPDGEHIAMTRRRKGSSEVVVVRVSTGEIVTRTAASKVDEMPTWSPDGQYLVFSSDRSGDPELYLMRRDGHGMVPLTQSPGPDWLPRWVAD